MLRQRQVGIIGGPSKFDLATRIFDGDNREQRPVTFTLREEGNTWEERIKLNSAQREDGSGESWNLTGYNVANSCQVEIYYNLRHRQGHMIFIPSNPEKSQWDKFVDELKRHSDYVVEFTANAKPALLNPSEGTGAAIEVRPLLMILKYGRPETLYYQGVDNRTGTAGFYEGKWCDHPN
jgi:hypothetical protein